MSSDNDESEAYKFIKEAPMVYTEPPKKESVIHQQEVENKIGSRKFAIPQWINDRF